ncbi:MAG: hypothetical protein JWM31_2114 [Solirubrobacterales bacterium]|nr:hypothetical protein [Solirubrobacterales bacterium]
MFDAPPEPIHVLIPGSPEDPRTHRLAPPGVIFHYAPVLHPDDLDVVHGIPVTSVSRTLIDCAEDADPVELRDMFVRAHERGLLDLEAMDASLARVEWRASLPLVREIVEEWRARLCP